MSTIEEAGYLPGLSPEAIGRRIVQHRAWGETVAVALPELTEDQAETLCAHVRARARETLRRMETARIVAAIDRASACLLDRAHPLRRKAEALLPVVTGYDRETVRLGLTSYLKTFRRPQLLRFLAEDFSNPAVLDGFQPAVKGGLVRARGPDLLLHVWAGNVPALPLWSLVSGLLVKAGTVGKLASAEPLTAGWFAQAIAEADPDLGECLAITWWKGGEGGPEATFLAQADCVMAYGGNDTLAALRAKVPVTARFLPHGHRIGFAMIAGRPWTAAAPARSPASPPTISSATSSRAATRRRCCSSSAVARPRRTSSPATSPTNSPRSRAAIRAGGSTRAKRRPSQAGATPTRCGPSTGARRFSAIRPIRGASSCSTTPWV